MKSGSLSGATCSRFYGLRRRYPGLEFSNRDEFGAIRLELRPGQARIAFVSIAGRGLDRAPVGCRSGR